LVLFLLSIVQLVDNLQALLLFSNDVLVESIKGAQLRYFDAKRGTLGVQKNPDAPSAPGAGGPPAGGASPPVTPAGKVAGVVEAGRPTPGRSPLSQYSSYPAALSAAAQARLAALEANDYGTVTAQRMQGDSQPLVSSVWDPERARRRAASKGLRGRPSGGAPPSPGSGQPPRSGSGTFVPP
jgi:hypothetical protein